MTNTYGLSIADPLIRFIEDKALPGTGVEAEKFWAGMADIFARFAPENRELLAIRARMEEQIDRWHIQQSNGVGDAESYQQFLRDIGYLVPEPEAFTIAPEKVDTELAQLAAPQLVVPILNTRFLLNAANARWGSLYDALYGTDAIAGEPAGKGYDADRGARVIGWVREFLDDTVPLAEGSWKNWDGSAPVLAKGAELVGTAGDNYLLRHNGLHLELVIDRNHPIGKDDPAGLADVIMEAAATTICDLEDSVAAVDTEDKVAAYTNWLGLLQGDLEAEFEKGGKRMTRRLNPDRAYRAKDGSEFALSGRSLLLVRNVGHLMTTPVVKLADGGEAPEGILDAIVTSLIGLHDLQQQGPIRNSRTGSIYIVKPKMHGPEEAAFTNRLFNAVEDLLGLARHTIKVGVMDEERRTSANLAASIHAVKDRVFFINTGFLDRTGDEMHTSMRAGPMVRKGDMKSSRWISAYEDRNVQIGLACGFSGKAQIGKGMWAAPDRMADMLEQKIGHPLSGASTAWVPSPTAAVLHATHYHRVDVAQRQAIRAREGVTGLDSLLTIPVATSPDWDATAIREELENNAQGILGYVVRWVDQGVGCSKVPDIHDIGLMEDRATLRISSQHMANWLLHGICSADDVDAAFQRMAAKVDGQNEGTADYSPMSGHEGTSQAYQAARALVFDGVNQPNGYTEPLLHHYRQIVKNSAG
ncbi:malate synthase G [Altererythrobacter indicus]|uniref:Malate synthase G n=1 Tax=Altericroceibacterium indicum TaxID=374177 RepID=A0A845ACC7_9SPHN|nr:malate synthase G [Altericroceibacterium indicum]MXP26405.1 malate synthase G [Altericroceibacterium indicum]